MCLQKRTAQINDERRRVNLAEDAAWIMELLTVTQFATMVVSLIQFRCKLRACSRRDAREIRPTAVALVLST